MDSIPVVLRLWPEDRVGLVRFPVNHIVAVDQIATVANLASGDALGCKAYKKQ